MRDFNLLPQELKPKGYTVKISKSLKKLQVIFIAIFLIALVIVILVNFGLSLQNGQVVKRTEALKKEIEALNQTEQRLILVQDRVGKIKKIEEEENALDEASIINEVIQNMPPEISIKGIHAEKGKSSLSVQAATSSDLTKYFTYIVSSSAREVKLASFKYDIGKGYEVEIALKK